MSSDCSIQSIMTKLVREYPSLVYSLEIKRVTVCERRSTGAELLARRFNRGLCACGAHVDRVPTLSPSPNPGAKSPGCRSLGKYPENS